MSTINGVRHNAIMIALTAPTSEAEDAAFNRWYDDVHLPEVAKLPGVVAARRYKAADIPGLPGISAPTHPYVAIYELGGDTEADLKRFMDAITAAVQDESFDMSGPMDGASGMILALPIGTPVSQ